VASAQVIFLVRGALASYQWYTPRHIAVTTSDATNETIYFVSLSIGAGGADVCSVRNVQCEVLAPLVNAVTSVVNRVSDDWIFFVGLSRPDRVKHIGWDLRRVTRVMVGICRNLDAQLAEGIGPLLISRG